MSQDAANTVGHWTCIVRNAEARIQTYSETTLAWTFHHHHHHHHHMRLFEVVKRNRQHTVQKIDVHVGIYMDIHTIHAG